MHGRTAVPILVPAVAALAALSSAYAQPSSPIGPGSLIVNGSVGASRTETAISCDSASYCPPSPPAYWSVQISPSVQYFVVKGLALGAQVSVAWTWYEGPSQSRSSSTGVGPIVTYYFGMGSKQVIPFVRAFGSAINTRETSGGTVYTYKAWSWAVAGGAVLMVARNIGLEGGLYYEEQRTTQPSMRQSVKWLRLGVGVATFLY